jgi:endonuclease G, mitochondrial
MSQRAILVVVSSVGGWLAASCGEAIPTGVTRQSVLVVAEGFESGSKGSYAAGDVTLTNGVWGLDDALIGTLSTDKKAGAKSARLRNSGRVTMKFNVATGISDVSIKHASYGTDASGTWGLYRSLDGGSTWAQVGGSVTTTGSLSTVSFTLNESGNVRLEIRKLDGGANRINIDDIQINDFDAPPPPPPPGEGAEISVHTTLGLPGPVSTTDATQYLSVKEGYVVSYNGSRKVPNWVSWELNESYLGNTSRTDDFRADDTLPAWVEQASLADYSASGYDRGHMCPSADRSDSTAANSETFYLTNMVPQSGDANSGPWARLETYSRKQATSGKELFIVAGGVFGPDPETIGAGVWVPDETFKVVVVLNAPGDDAADVSAATRVIAVLMPNRDADVWSTDWRDYRVDVRTIETLTGFDFLSDVSVAVQDVVETRVDDL